MMWWHDANCKDTGNLFITPGKIKRKKAICSQCSVVNECLLEAMQEHDYSDIVYGGFTGSERKLLSEGMVL